jgi:hypothetical protein
MCVCALRHGAPVGLGPGAVVLEAARRLLPVGERAARGAVGGQAGPGRHVRVVAAVGPQADDNAHGEDVQHLLWVRE